MNTETEQTKKERSITLTPSLETIVETFLSKVKVAKDLPETRKQILRCTAGFLKPSVLTKYLRAREVASSEIKSLIHQIDGSTAITSLYTAILYSRFTNTPINECLKITFVNIIDYEYFEKHLNIESLNVNEAVYSVPEYIDPYMLRTKDAVYNRLETKNSPLGELIEDYATTDVHTAFIKEVRSLICNFVLANKVTEADLANAVLNKYSSWNGVLLRKIVMYADKNSKLIIAAFNGDKVSDKHIQADVDYINRILKS